MYITALQALCMCGFIHDVSYITALQLSVCLDVYEMSAASLPYKLCVCLDVYKMFTLKTQSYTIQIFTHFKLSHYCDAKLQVGEN